jgi:hypothetical protein
MICSGTRRFVKKALLLAIATSFLGLPQAPAQGLATRNARFWMNHAFVAPGDAMCVNLSDAVSANGGQLDLGFIVLPIADRNQNDALDSEDAVIEALGLYWRDSAYRYSLNDKTWPSLVCRRRKQLAVELIAAVANTVLLGANPTDVTGSTDLPLPADLIDRARDAAKGIHPDEIAVFTALLRKFNDSGLTNDLPPGMLQCSAERPSDLRKLARNPTKPANCRAGH